VLDSVEVGALTTSLPPAHALHALAPEWRRCQAGTAWEWDGVRFEFLHPGPSELKTVRRNDLSCVLRIATAGGAMLLTGDIEHVSESSLVRMGDKIRSDVLLVPHHGSRTSSTEQFIAAVAPDWAVVPVGYRSRFGHPDAQVLERYRAAGAGVLRTDLDGAVQIHLTNEGIQVGSERSRTPRYWRARPPV
jgi:competence protein ComEC